MTIERILPPCAGQSGAVFSYQSGDFMKDVITDGIQVLCVCC